MPVTFADDTWTVQYGPEDTDRYRISMCDNYFLDGDPTYILGGIPLSASRERAVIIAKEVYDIYWVDTIEPYFRRNRIKPILRVLEISEATKTPETLASLARWLKKQNIDRRNQPLIAIGGGVLTDIVGMLAMLFMRGVGWVRIVVSTQMWDAGNSGKSAVNLDDKKSALGGFYAPLWGITDRTFLKTVPAVNLIDGFTELVKDGLVCDSDLFWLTHDFGPQVIRDRFQGSASSSPALEMIKRGTTVNLTENADNFTETNLYRAMHAGHNHSPWWEGYLLGLARPTLHGAAVSADLSLFVELMREGVRNPATDQVIHLDSADADAALHTLRQVGLPTYLPMMSDRTLVEAAHASLIRSRGGLPRVPLTPTIGECVFIDEFDIDQLVAAGNRLAAA